MNRLEKETSPLLVKNRSSGYCKYVVFMLLMIVIAVSLLYSPVSSKHLLSRSKRNSENNNGLSVSHMTGSDPFSNYGECDAEDPPTINGFHIHGIFDGNNQDSIDAALDAYHSFIDYVNPDMEECSFSHSNSGEFQTEICHFPASYEETDFPIKSNVIFSSSNYAFYIPKSLLQSSIEWWMQHHYSISKDVSFDFIIHPVTGCQTNDHTLWFINSKDYEYKLVKENLICCHSGPSKCTCELASYKVTINDNEKCLTANFVDSTSNGQIIFDDCPSDDDIPSLRTWRENTYSEDNGWLQIENFGDMTSPIYMCLAVISSDDNNDDVCSIGNKIELMDCSTDQVVDDNEWVAKKTRFQLNSEKTQIKFIGCDNTDEDLCLDLKLDNDNNIDYAYLQKCQDSIVFERIYFP